MKTKALLYCTKAKPSLMEYTNIDGYYTDYDPVLDKRALLNGKIVAECDYEVEKIDTMALSEHVYDDYYNDNIDRISKRSCLTCEQMSEYLGTTWDSKGYAIHIKNLKERVMELSNVYKYDNSYDNMFGWVFEDREKYIPLTKAPQNMMRVWLFENGEWVMYILISIQPQWMCLILNRIKDVEVRKVVLKEMIN